MTSPGSRKITVNSFRHHRDKKSNLISEIHHFTSHFDVFHFSAYRNYSILIFNLRILCCKVERGTPKRVEAPRGPDSLPLVNFKIFLMWARSFSSNVIGGESCAASIHFSRGGTEVSGIGVGATLYSCRFSRTKLSVIAPFKEWSKRRLSTLRNSLILLGHSYSYKICKMLRGSCTGRISYCFANCLLK